MKTNFLMVLLTLAFATTTPVRASRKARYSAPRICWDTSSESVPFESGCYARLKQLQDKRLICVTESGGIAVKFSSTLGKTWGNAKVIAKSHNNISVANPEVLQLADGTILVAYNNRPQSPYTEDRKFGIRLRRSTDNGKTWSDEIQVFDAGSNPTEGCWEPAMLELPDGELQLYFANEYPYQGDNTDQEISLCRSFDQGLTWSEPQRVSYRKGYRDGMPVPLLLNDQSDIVIAIEDNGWSEGAGDFIPTIVRCTLKRNWSNDFYVPSTSTNRAKAVDYNQAPLARSGAPYIAQLPSGETILSHQSRYHGGENKMLVYVGDKQAKNFHGMSTPFKQHEKAGLWNSLAVIDTGIVMAIGGIGNEIHTMRGYPLHAIQAKYATPSVNGTQSSSDGYYNKEYAQFQLGAESGTRLTADYAYNTDSLYITARAYDTTRDNTDQGDAILLYIDAANASDTRPVAGTYRITFRRNGTAQIEQGEQGKWKENDHAPIHLAVKNSGTNYTIEAAIPWILLGHPQVLATQPIGTTLQLRDLRNGTAITEVLPDIDTEAPWTWTLLQLQPNPDAILCPTAAASRPTAAYDLFGRKISSQARGIIVENGKKILRK